MKRVWISKSPVQEVKNFIRVVGLKPSLVDFGVIEEASPKKT
jgi:hypothetical protein